MVEEKGVMAKGPVLIELDGDAAADGMNLFPILYNAFVDKDMSLLDIAESFVAPKLKQVEVGCRTARKLIKFYRGMQTVAEQLTGDDIVLAESCIFKPGGGFKCSGGAFDFATNDGSRRALQDMQELQEMETV